MKKVIVGIILAYTFCIFRNKSYAISNEFQFVIDTIGIPRYNVYNDEINEEVYYTYNVFSYGKPNKITTNQRWKNSKYGLWTKNGGSYKNKGTRGEYYILGKSYSGAVIYNYYFPMDVIPSTTPDKWTFYSYPGAKDSWKDTSKYKYIEQLDYMKNSKLMFNDISSRDRADNPKYIKEYNITASSIGLSKARLDVAATWKTYGMISTRRIIDGIIYSQVYLVKPMAANASVESKLYVEDEYTLNEIEDELLIPIKYETSVINMTGYADKKHIKEIKAVIYVNNEKKDEISGSKIISVGNEYILVVTRDNYPPNNYEIEIKLDGYMHTEFAVDGLMQDKVSKIIKVHVEPKLIIPVKEKSIMVLEKSKETLVVRPLAQNLSTSNNSEGFTEAGKYIVLKFLLTVPKERIKDMLVYLDDKLIKNIKQYDSENLIFSFKIPQDTVTSLYGEYSLRNENKNYFKISKDMTGSRKTVPHKVLFEYKINGKKFEEEIFVDTLDYVMTNINSKVSGIIDESSVTKLEDWLNE